MEAKGLAVAGRADDEVGASGLARDQLGRQADADAPLGAAAHLLGRRRKAGLGQREVVLDRLGFGHQRLAVDVAHGGGRGRRLEDLRPDADQGRAELVGDVGGKVQPGLGLGVDFDVNEDGGVGHGGLLAEAIFDRPKLALHGRRRIALDQAPPFDCMRNC